MRALFFTALTFTFTFTLGSTPVLLLGFVDETRVASRDDEVVRSSR